MKNLIKKPIQLLFCALVIIGLIKTSAISSDPVQPANQQGTKLEVYVAAIAKKINSHVPQAIGNIQGISRQLLAIRGYLRSANSIDTKWSWTNEEIAQYKQSAEYAAAMAEVKKVTAKFEEQNPGFTIYVNTEVRSLDAQIRNWNETKSVADASEGLLRSAQQEISNQIYKDNPDAQSLAKFEQFLKNQNLSITPTVATPGLSQHGQLRAFDFQIKKGNQIVAGTESSVIESIWEAQGWTQKLNTAVTSASKKFTGPLVSPREPWHYIYNP